jgi:predicted ATP-dependent protease
MPRLDDIPEGTEFTTTIEVNGIRNTLDQFMKKEEKFDDTLQQSLDKILNKLSGAPQTQEPINLEDIGSSTKAKDTSTIPQAQNPQNMGPTSKPQQKSDAQKMSEIYKSQEVSILANPSHQRYYTPPVLRARMMQQQAESSAMGVLKAGVSKYWPFGTHFGEMDFTEEVDLDEDWQERPWEMYENVEKINQDFPKQDFKVSKEASMVTGPRGMAGEVAGPVVGWCVGGTEGGGGAARRGGGGWRPGRVGGGGKRCIN